MAEQKQLTRSSEERVLGGVCAGLGKYLGVDTVLVRLVFLALAFVNGLGAMLYMIMWVIVPSDSNRELSGEDAVRANVDDMAQQFRQLGHSINAPRGATLVGVALIGFGAIFLIQQFFPGLSLSVLWPGVLIAIGCYLLFFRK
ncbi:MAG: PspC domain-containing protein [Anaerolineae bacterium]|nr:PspC domain-containing protein [Anaerolineae bacterium]